MRPYRAIPIDGKDFVYGWYAEVEGKHFIVFNECRLDYEEDFGSYLLFRGIVEVIPETVGQSTGLKDKNGKEIYEGDIIKSERGTYKVEWQQEWSRYVGAYIKYDYVKVSMLTVIKEKVEIIGNVHQPELKETDNE